MGLLIVENNSKISLFIRNGMKKTGFAVNHATGGEKGL